MKASAKSGLPRFLTFLKWMTPRRLRAQTIVLAVCLWGVCVVDYATPGVFDRGGNVKFQDFLQFPIAARLITQGRSSSLYDDQTLANEIRATVGRDPHIYLRYFYGPQVAVPFIPFARSPFLVQASAWVGFSLLIYFGCVYALWKKCDALRTRPGLVALCAIAYPPLFHFFVRGHLSATLLVCMTLAYFGFRARRDWLAGIALGFLVFKPQFLVAIPFVLLLAQAWKTFAGVVLSAAFQLGCTLLYFGPAIMRTYLETLLHSAERPSTTELSLSLIQMHSLRSFWVLLVPWPRAVLMLIVVSSLAAIAIAAVVWKSSLPLPLRFSALILAAVLVNPHIYIYDLLVLVPALLLMADWIVNNLHHSWTPVLALLLYLSFVLPLFGPVARWTHLQISVVVFAALLVCLWRISIQSAQRADQELASTECLDV